MKRIIKPTSPKKGGADPNMFDRDPWGQFFQHGKRLDELRVFVEHGIVQALYDALVLLRIERRDDAADWVLAACQDVIKDRIGRRVVIGKGRTGNELKRSQQALIHFRRWEAVKTVRANGIRGLEADKQALERLRGTPAGFADPDAIKKSYQKVRKDLQDPNRRYLYYLAISSLATPLKDRR